MLRRLLCGVVCALLLTLSGLGQTGGTQFCNIFGSTVTFTQQQLAAQYGSPFRFAVAWSRATLRSFAAGFLLPVDALQLWSAGVHSDVLR